MPRVKVTSAYEQVALGLEHIPVSVERDNSSGWDTNRSHCYHQHFICRYPFIHLGGESVKSLLKSTTHCPQLGLQPTLLDAETLTKRVTTPLHLTTWELVDFLSKHRTELALHYRNWPHCFRLTDCYFYELFLY